MGTSSSKAPKYENLPRRSSTSQQSGRSFSPPPQDLVQPRQDLVQPPPSAPPLPDGWHFDIDPRSGYPYFFNSSTGVSQWEDPRGGGFALPERSNALHREVTPPWEGGPADGDPLSWPLPPGWEEQYDEVSNRRQYVNYSANIISYRDPRLEIARAYAQQAGAEGVPSQYPPPALEGPVGVEPPSLPNALRATGPQTWSSNEAGPSLLPPPKMKKKHFMWSKLGYRPGRGVGGHLGGSSIFLFNDPEVPGVEVDSSSSSSSSDDEDQVNKVRGDPGASFIGQNLRGNDDPGATNSTSPGGDSQGSGGDSTDMQAVDQYGRPSKLIGGGGVTEMNLSNVGGGGSVSGVYQQPLSGSLQNKALDNCLPGWDDGLKGSLEGRRFWMLDGYAKLAIVLTVLVGAYFGVAEGFISFLLAFIGKLLLFLYKRGKIVRDHQKRTDRKFGETVQWAFMKKVSPLVQLKGVAVSQCTQIQAWFFEHLHRHQLARVRMLTAKDGAAPLYSRLPSRPRDITIVTQASADRLPAIEAMAESWGGVMCVAIHARTQAELRHMYPVLQDLHDRIELLGSCRLNICVAKEVGLTTDEERMKALYPINAMRNIATSMATTELIFILDADFVPSLGMHDLLTGDETVYSEILRKATAECQMLVVPAFEAMVEDLGDLETARITFPTRMCELREWWNEGSAKAFHCSHFPRGHNPTNYQRFFDLSTSKPYRVEYREFYEPYTICGRETIPPFDARFRGYGMNKISHAYHCAVKGMGFSVLPQIFVWSLPHDKSQSWAHTFGENKDPMQKLRILGLYRRFKAEIRLTHRSRNVKTVQTARLELLEIKVEESRFLPLQVPA